MAKAAGPIPSHTHIPCFDRGTHEVIILCIYTQYTVYLYLTIMSSVSVNYVCMIHAIIIIVIVLL